MQNEVADNQKVQIALFMFLVLQKLLISLWFRFCSLVAPGSQGNIFKVICPNLPLFCDAIVNCLLWISTNLSCLLHSRFLFIDFIIFSHAAVRDSVIIKNFSNQNCSRWLYLMLWHWIDMRTNGTWSLIHIGLSLFHNWNFTTKFSLHLLLSHW